MKNRLYILEELFSFLFKRLKANLKFNPSEEVSYHNFMGKNLCFKYNPIFSSLFFILLFGYKKGYVLIFFLGHTLMFFGLYVYVYIFMVFILLSIFLINFVALFYSNSYSNYIIRSKRSYSLFLRFYRKSHKILGGVRFTYILNITVFLVLGFLYFIYLLYSFCYNILFL